MMKQLIPPVLRELAERFGAPLYAVGGTVRDCLAGFPLGERPDWDVSSPADENELLRCAERCGWSVRSVFRNTGTVKLEKDGVQCEFTRFRSDKYVRGVHAPSEIEFTDDIRIDARRRDFTANAVYYAIKADALCDPLGGAEDIRKKIMRTVVSARKVFGEDGLRLMRLARLCAQTGFMPDPEAYAGAREHAALIEDIAPERIFTELSLLLSSDLKHGDPEAPYRGLCVLRDTEVLKRVLPELALGDGLAQRADFHSHDVLEHTFRCVKYSPPEIRFAALLHDCGKPYCYFRDGNFHAHAEEGKRIATEILTRLKAPKKLIKETGELVAMHMRDFNLQMRENGVRKLIAERRELFFPLLALMQADYSACKDDLSPAPAAVKWRAIYDKMEREHAPRSLRELSVNGRQLQAAGVPAERTGAVLHELLLLCAYDGKLNDKDKLLRYAAKHYAT